MSSIIIFSLESKLQIENNIQEFRILLSTEISTIFLNLHNMFDANIYTIFININQFLFVSTFFYNRIYLYTKYIIYGKMNNYSLIISFLIYAFYLKY